VSRRSKGEGSIYRLDGRRGVRAQVTLSRRQTRHEAVSDGRGGHSLGSVRPADDRLDILGFHISGELVVAELKRDRAPDTVEMQAIKYAAMVSTPKWLVPRTMYIDRDR
jgi:hypothetical protein